MNTLYPEHTPPAPPEGMKWEYRGMGWQPCEITRYYSLDPDEEYGVGDSVLALPSGNTEYHYFEAVPDFANMSLEECLHGKNPEWTWMNLASEKTIVDEVTKNREWVRRATADEILGENPHDPKGEAGSLKAPLCLLPSYPLHEASWVLDCGRKKYGVFNWRKNKVCASTYRSAMQRHLDQWFDGLEDADEETSRSHLAHVIASACIVMDAAKHGTLVDDRP